MIYIDSRVGSKELLKYFNGKGELARLDYGDFSFIGNGPEQDVLMIGIERKTVSDFLQSYTSGRLIGHQLPGLASTYNYIYLVIEGAVKPDRDGVMLQATKGGEWSAVSPGGNKVWMYKDYVKALQTLSMVKNVQVVGTYSATHTAAWTIAIYDWWQTTWEDHTSYIRLYTGPDLHFTMPSAKFKIATCIDGIGPKRAKEVCKVFKTPAEMVNATFSQWSAIPGIGPKIAAKIFNSIHEER